MKSAFRSGEKLFSIRPALSVCTASKFVFILRQFQALLLVQYIALCRMDTHYIDVRPDSMHIVWLCVGIQTHRYQVHKAAADQHLYGTNGATDVPSNTHNCSFTHVFLVFRNRWCSSPLYRTCAASAFRKRPLQSPRNRSSKRCVAAETGATASCLTTSTDK